MKSKKKDKNKNNFNETVSQGKEIKEIEIFNVDDFEVTIPIPTAKQTPTLINENAIQETKDTANTTEVEKTPKEEKKKKEPKEKLSDYEKNKRRIQREEELLSRKGIPKFWTTHIVETLLIFTIEMLVKMILGSFSFDYTILRIFLSSNILSLIITLITTNLPKKIRNGILIIINFFIAIYAWLQLGFQNYIGMFMSLGNAEQGTKIGEFVFDFLSSYKIQYFLVWLPFILACLYLYFEREITKNGFAKKLQLKSLLNDFALIVYLALMCFGFYVTIEVDFMQNKYQTVSNKALFKYPSNPSLAVKNFGTTVYFALDIKSMITGSGDVTYNLTGVDGNKPQVEETDYTRKIDDEAWENLIKIETDKNLNTLNNYFINKDITDMNEYTGKFKNKNLVMVMLESVSEAVFHDEYAEYFPTLNKLYHEGIVGVNNYSPRNNCSTGESEYTSQTSLYTIETTCTVNTYRNNEYREALFYMLRNNGYYTTAYHNWNDQYYYRKTYETKLGSYRYYDATALKINIGSGTWPSDVDLFQNALPNFIDQARFASYLVTVSSHMPYKISSTTGNKYSSMFDNTSFSKDVKRYLSKIKYVDLALEHLLTSLEESGKLDDTVIVLFGDHYPYGLNDKDFASVAPYDISTTGEVDRTPFIIYNSETEPEKITKYMTPLDYAPTLLNLFGIDYDPRYYMGHDVYSDYTDYVVYADNSWKSSLGYYSASKGIFEPINDTVTISDEEIIRINNEVNDMRTMSNLAIKKNYFSYLFKYFDEYAELKRQKEEAEKQPESESTSKEEDEKEEKSSKEEENQ